MDHELKLEDIDVDGAVRETAAEAMESLSGDTRSQFLRRAGLAGGAVVGGGAVLGALAPSAFAAGGRPPASVFGGGDIGILRYALTLEYLEAAFYNEATRKENQKSFLSKPEQKTFLRAVTTDENQHVTALRKALGKKVIKKPKFNFHGDTADEQRFLKASYTFENTGVHAYSGQAFNIKSPKVLATALSIVTIEARHAAVVGLLRFNSDHGITPDGAFDTPLSAKAVLNGVASLHYIQKK